MSHIRSLSGLRREIHHVKLMKDGSERYEPAMVLLSDNKKGRCFIITLEALHKYIEPHNNRDEASVLIDKLDFDAIAQKARGRQMLAVTTAVRQAAAEDLAECVVAVCLAKSMGLLLCTSWNLAKMFRMFDIEANPANAFDILCLIQDGLDELRSYPEHPNADTHGSMGEVSIFESGRRIATKEMTVSDKDVYVHPGSEAKH